MTLLKLVFSNLTTRKVRTALTLAAIALSVSLVVAVTSGYKSAEAAIYEYLMAHAGAADLQIAHKNDASQGVDQRLIAQLRADPDVHSAAGRLETDAALVDKANKRIPTEIIGIDPAADPDIGRSPVDQGRWFDSTAGDVAVIDQHVADALKLKVGDPLALPGVLGRRRLTVVGICHKPDIFAADDGSWVYLPLETCQALADRTGQVTRVLVNLRPNVDHAAFAARWEARAKAADPDLKVRRSRDTRKTMDEQLAGVHFVSYMGCAVSLLVAAFIIFTALSMGVAERQRTLAMLRAIGAYRAQIAGMVVVEGALLGLSGALLGVPLGVLWTALLVAWRRAEFFTAGLHVDGSGVALGVGAAGFAALLAGIFPAWAASRVTPLEAMVPLARAASMRGPARLSFLGLALIAVDPVTIFLIRPSPNALFYEHFFVGLPAMFVGFFLIAPVVVWAVERGLGDVVPRLMRVRPSLVRQQLTGGVWRAAGTGSALMMGLAILVVLQTVGHSMLAGWALPKKFPDVFIYAGQGLTRDQWARLDQVQGVKRGEVMAMSIAFPEFPEDGPLGGLSLFGVALLPNATMFVGVEPDKALDMMRLDFRQGSPAAAAAALKGGDQVIVTEEFGVLKGLKLGDDLKLMTRQGNRNFKVCGVVRSPGIDVMVQMFDLGKLFDQRTVATVFGSITDAEKYFGKDRASLFAANLDDAVPDKAALLKAVKERLGEQGWRAGDIRRIKAEIEKGIDRMLMLLSTIAFAAMAVAALGVTNTVMASVRSRQWQFGILRSIGVTRGQLMRLVLAESILLGVVGCALGLAAGFLLSYNATGLSRQMIGVAFDLAPPWGMIAAGTVIVLCVSILSALWPAAHAARSAPLTLLQSGRAAV